MLGLPFWSAFTLLFSRSDDADKPCADVGGGSVVNRTRNSLARIPLRWMIRECFKCQTGILFLTDKLRGVGLDPETLLTSAVHQPRPKRLHGHGRIVKKPEIPSVLDRFLVSANPRDWAILNSDRKNEVKNKKEEVSDVMFKNEEEEELLDAISPKYDQLKISPSWWILELLPWTVKKRNLCVFCSCVMTMYLTLFVARILRGQGLSVMMSLMTLVTSLRVVTSSKSTDQFRYEWKQGSLLSITRTLASSTSTNYVTVTIIASFSMLIENYCHLMFAFIVSMSVCTTIFALVP